MQLSFQESTLIFNDGEVLIATGKTMQLVVSVNSVTKMCRVNEMNYWFSVDRITTGCCNLTL